MDSTQALDDARPAGGLPFWGRAAVFVECRLYPLYYLYFTAQKIPALLGNFGQARASASALLHPPNAALLQIHALVVLAYLVRASMIPYNVLVMYALARPRPAPREFKSSGDVWIPFFSATVTSRADFLINSFNSLHDVMDDLLFSLTPGFLATAYLLILAGRALSAAGILLLGPSFGVLIAARPLVKTGIYRYLKHPIYLGYMIALGGAFLVNPSRSMILFMTITAILFIVRAKLEEERLSAAYPEYRR